GDDVFRNSEPSYAEIVLIRHGETDWNKDRIFQGQLDVELNHVGRQQALAVAERLSMEPKISAVYSSDLRRASETAEIIARHCGVPMVNKDPNLRERHCGDLQGLPYHKAAKAKPHSFKAFLSKQGDQEIPGGGESYNQLYDRCTTALEAIAKRHVGERIAVVSHGAAMETLHRRGAPTGGSSSGGTKIVNTSVNVLHVSPNGRWSIESWGDVSHLKQQQGEGRRSAFGGD
ncbi:phosphoglycerate mutase, partial [Genlisea aurea]